MNVYRTVIIICICLPAFIFAGCTGTDTVQKGAVPAGTQSGVAVSPPAGEGGKIVKLHAGYTVDGQPILGTYGASNLEELAMVKDVGMNVILGGLHDLDTKSPRGKYCLENGIKVMHHMTQHLYGKPRLGDAVTADQTTIPLLTPASKGTPESGVIQIEDELIRYRERTPTELRGCQRGFNGTKPAAHRERIILFFPEECAAEVERVKDSPNLWGYYVLDDSPGDALSALRAMYKVIHRVDPKRRPVCAGYGSAGSLCNFGPEVCDIMMIYWYPVSNSGYSRYMTSHQVQWMLGAARERVPGIPFIGVYQAFNAGDAAKPAIPTAEQLREQIEDFVREGACGLVAFLCRAAEPNNYPGWAAHTHMQNVLRDAHREILATGGLQVRPQPTGMICERVQRAGFWRTPRKVPGVVPEWDVIGPFDDSDRRILEATFPPDRYIDLAGVYQGKSGPVRWHKRLSCGGIVGLGELFGMGGYVANTIAYALCTVTSPRSRKMQMRFGSDDDAIVWLNDKEIWRHNGSRGLERDNDIIDIVLPAGESWILVKVCNRSGMWGFFMRFTSPDGRPVKGLRFSTAGG